jgi:hypothetical protein
MASTPLVQCLTDFSISYRSYSFSVCRTHVPGAYQLSLSKYIIKAGLFDTTQDSLLLCCKHSLAAQRSWHNWLRL